jgi:hypothetical protein
MEGRIICERFLQKMRNNNCYKCQGYGHFADHCKVNLKSTTQVSITIENKKTNDKQNISQNKFASLDDSCDEEEDVPPANVTLRKLFSSKKIAWIPDKTPDEVENKPPANVTIRNKNNFRSKSWADYDSDDSDDDM